TEKLGVRMGSEDFDSPSTPPPYGIAGWTKDDRHVLVYDRYDIWLITPDGSAVKNLTQGIGRKDKIQFRLVRLDPGEKALDPVTPLLLRAESELTRDTGFYRAHIEGSAPEKLIMAAKRFSAPTKAKDADVLLLTASTFNEFPDLLVTNGNFSQLKKVSDA